MVEYIAFLAGGACLLIIGLVAIRASYNSGVCDGYGYAKEPENPHYARAGEYLRDVMSHQWPELGERPRNLRAEFDRQLERRKNPREY